MADEDESAVLAVPFDPAAHILYRDADILILDKPAGLPVHGGPRSARGSALHLGHYLEALRFGLPQLPQLAHRLDRDTSGCLVLGRHAAALRRLGGYFAQNRVTKTYWALVQGAPPQPQGVIDAPLLRVQGGAARGGFGFRMVVDAAGQDAVTDYTLRGQHDGISWLELRPCTGRTHQLRVHCAHLGCPIIGDVKYGPPPYAPQLMLHARSIALPGKPPVTAVAPPPESMAALLKSFSQARL